MGKTPSRTNKKTSESRGENGKKPQSLTESINKQVNAAEEKVQEIEERGKPKRGKIAELTKRLEEAAKRAEEAEARIKDLEESSAKKDKDLAAAEQSIKELQAEGQQKSEGIQILNDNLKIYKDGAKSLVNRQKALREDYENVKKDKERLSKTNQDYRTQNSILTESIRQSALKSDKEVTDAVNALEPKTEEVKTDNSGTTEGTATPETGEVKVESEPKANTEQATQEPKNEAKQPSTESSEMTPEEAYEYLSDKKNFKEANTYFLSGKDSYIGTNGKHLPKSWFDVYNGNKNSDHSIQPFLFNKNNKDVFTASLRDKGLLEDPKKEPSREDTVKTLTEADAKRKFDEWIDSKGNKFRGIFGKHKVLYNSLLGIGSVPLIMKAIDAIGDWYVNKAIENNHVSDEAFFGENDDNEDFNGEPIEPGNVAEQVANAAQETEQAGNNAEEQAAQTLQENLPQGVTDATNQSKGENPVPTNASTPASTKASTAKSAPAQGTQGLPPVVTRDAPPANPDSSGMTYSQRVEAGQAPQAGSMAYNANNPDMVTAGLIDAMNQNSQAGSDGIGYGDLYDQNFIDFWAKRNPNLAFGVSQGRKS